MYVFTYTSKYILDEHDFVLCFGHSYIVIQLKNRKLTIEMNGLFKFKLNRWNHICWSWESQGHWKLYLAGSMVKWGQSHIADFITLFPESSGILLLGQNMKAGIINHSNQMFTGKISQLYIFNSLLTSSQVKNSYAHRSPTDNVIFGWWRFKNKTNGTKIVEEPFPW